MDNAIGFNADQARMGLRHEDGRPATVYGYVLVWGELTLPALAGDRVVRLRFPRDVNVTLTEPTLAWVMHNRGRLLGRVDNGTLRVLPPDDYGLPFEIDLPATQEGRDTAVLIARGDYAGSSAGITVEAVASTEETTDALIVNVAEVRIREVSIVDVPALPSATATLELPELKPVPVEEITDGDDLYKLKARMTLATRRQSFARTQRK